MAIKMVGGWGLCPVWRGCGRWVVQCRAETALEALTVAPQCLQGDHWEDSAPFLKVMCGRRTRDNGHKLKQKTFRLAIRKNKFHPQDSQAVEEGPTTFGQCPSLGVSRPDLVKPWAARSDLTAEPARHKEVNSLYVGLRIPELGHWHSLWDTFHIRTSHLHLGKKHPVKQALMVSPQ